MGYLRSVSELNGAFRGQLDQNISKEHLGNAKLRWKIEALCLNAIRESQEQRGSMLWGA